ncbi:Dihydrolipoyl dehydrogenase [Candidatus Xenohaliotis californiensis]|uniref:Dihydrolipoyl dehydrogenase n=2 Tax=Candidatus Xenohaliotis californiensis TaxID=84677 RepID=A0ABP0EVG2_9RICK|nr:Dihydrolipoyl dehydrogenase [Candidatus Xenohaliotis californiensis]
MGMKTAIIEQSELGGICLNWGCIPTKSLLKAAEVYRNIENAHNFGIMAQNIGFDFKKIIAKSRDSANQLAKGVSYLMKKNKITTIIGKAKLISKNEILVNAPNAEQKKFIAKNIVIATGASPRAIPGMEFNGDTIWNYKHAMSPNVQPKSLLIIGSGAIGIEFADFYNTFDTNVTIVEKQPAILPGIDKELGKIMHSALEKRGINIYTSTSVSKIDIINNQVHTTINNEQQSFEKILIAVGVEANTKDLGLDEIGVETEHSKIVIDRNYQTSVPNIYAIGDVTGGICLAHKAAHDAISCIEGIAGLNCYKTNDEEVPMCIYAHPQIASVGLTESALREKKCNIKVGHFYYKANGKAVATNETVGMTKIISDAKTGEILGAHIIGDNATEIIHAYVVAKSTEAIDISIQRTIFAHPTLSEILHEAALDLDNIAINS